MTADFSSELVQVRKEYSNIFKGTERKKTVNLEFCGNDFQKQKWNTFSDIWKLKEYITCQPILQEMLKEEWIYIKEWRAIGMVATW